MVAMKISAAAASRQATSESNLGSKSAARGNEISWAQRIADYGRAEIVEFCSGRDAIISREMRTHHGPTPARAYMSVSLPACASTSNECTHPRRCKMECHRFQTVRPGSRPRSNGQSRYLDLAYHLQLLGWLLLVRRSVCSVSYHMPGCLRCSARQNRLGSSGLHASPDHLIRAPPALKRDAMAFGRDSARASGF